MINFLKSLFLVISILFSSSVFATWHVCTGFFVSSDGYIGTAAHCYGDYISIRLEVNGKKVFKKAQVIAKDTIHDVMLLKIDTVNAPFFKLNTDDPLLYSELATIGYPSPDDYGYWKHTRIGEVIGDKGKVFVMHLWSQPGSSGSPVFDSNNTLHGVLVECYQSQGRCTGKATYIAKSKYLEAIAERVGVFLQYSMSVYSHFDEDYFKNNKDKIILIYSETRN